MYEVLLLIVELFDMSVYRRYLDVYLKELRTTQGVSALILLSCAAVNTAAELYVDGWIRMVLLIMVLFLFSIQYDRRSMSRILAVCVYIGIVAISEPAGYAACSVLGRYLSAPAYVTECSVVFARGLARIFLTEAACRVKNNRNIELSKLPRSVAAVLFMIPASSLISCLLLADLMKSLFSEKLIVLSISIIYTIIVTNYLAFLMMGEYTAAAEGRHEEELLLQEAEYKDEYYREVERYMGEIQDIRHDMKNRLAGICYIAENEGTEQVREVVLQMLGGIEQAEAVLYTANPTVNSILRLKAAKAEEYGIRMELNVVIPRKLSVETGDLGVLYGNPLDNAIEACRRMPEDGRFIQLDSRYSNGNLIIAMRNSKLSGENRELRTTKKDRRQHGRGIRLVRRTAERYRGTFLAEDQGEVFEARILLREIEQVE